MRLHRAQLQTLEPVLKISMTEQGLVKLDDPDAKIKFLATEALHRVGSLVFDTHGNRFADELRRRSHGAGEMWKNKPPFRLALKKVTSDEIASITLDPES